MKSSYRAHGTGKALAAIIIVAIFVMSSTRESAGDHTYTSSKQKETELHKELPADLIADWEKMDAAVAAN